MVSRTKYQLNESAIRLLFRTAGLGEAERIAPLGAGEYNAVFAVTAGGNEYALKVAPGTEVPVLHYEHNMMASEVQWYQTMREQTSITVPKVYASDFSRTLIPTDYFIMELLPGTPLGKAKLSQKEKAEAAAQTARMAAEIHRVKHDRFGYIQNELYGDWHQALRAMVQACLRDCARMGKSSRRGEQLLGYIDRHRDTLGKAECCMVNFDIWPSNIICRRENGALHYAWIDPERSYWGDPIVDFVCLEFQKPLAGKTASLAAYNAAADAPVHVTEEERIRYAAAQAYLALIMETEKYYRYTPHHFGWWRNVLMSTWFYRAAFEVLGNA